MTAFDWLALLRAGLAMGLKPHEFWALTPAEFEMMLGRGAGVAPMGRDRLEELRAAFPDERGRARDE